MHFKPWLNMDRITNVYIEFVKYGVLEKRSKDCDLSKLNLVNTVTLFLTKQSKSIILFLHNVCDIVFQQCMVLRDIKIWESMHKEISFITNNVKFENQIQLYQFSLQNPLKKSKPHETCSLPYSAASNIHKHKLYSTGKKLFRKNLLSAKLIENATQNRISFHLFVGAIYQFI